MQQRTAEAPVEFLILVSQERVQQRIAEARPELQRTVERASRDFVEADKTIPQERISEQMHERSEVIEVPKISYQSSRILDLDVFEVREGRGGTCFLCRHLRLRTFRRVEIVLSETFFSSHRRASTGLTTSSASQITKKKTKLWPNLRKWHPSQTVLLRLEASKLLRAVIMSWYLWYWR